MSFAVFPTFNEIFPGKQRPSLEEILRTTSSATLLKIAAFLNSRIHITQLDIKEQETIFFRWIGVFDMGTRQNIWSNYLKFKERNEARGSRICLFNSIALLRLMDRIVISYNNIEPCLEATTKEEMVFLHAWLISNSELGDEIQKSAKPTAHNLFETILISQASQHEFVERKDIFTQILFSGSFFDYLSENLTYEPFLKEFLANKKLQSHHQYLRALAEVYIKDIGQDFSFTLTPDNQFLASLFDSFTLPTLVADPMNPNHPKIPDQDFKTFRTFPMVNIGEGTYYILHNNFFVDKLYQGAIFDFYKQTSVCEKVGSFASFLQKLGSSFAESKIFYTHAARCFRQDRHIVKVTGDQYNTLEYTDYYVREGKSIFLFEFKNVLISSAVKQSMNYKTIEQEIFKKLVRNEKGKPKGVTQLCNVIKNLVAKPFPFDNFLNKKFSRLNIYPILVCTDDFFNVDGVEKIVNDEFQRQLLNQDFGKHKINPAVIIHINDLISLQLTRISSKKNFQHVIDLYHERKAKRRKRSPQKFQDILLQQQGFKTIMSEHLRNHSDNLIDQVADTLKLNDS